MKICLDFGFVEGFWNILIGFGWSSHEERHTRVRLKWDEDGFGKMDIHHLVRTSINKSATYLHISNELWKWEFSDIGLRQTKGNDRESFPTFKCSSGRVFCGFQILVLIKLCTFLLTWTPVAADRETLKGNFGNAYLYSI